MLDVTGEEIRRNSMTKCESIAKGESRSCR